MATVHQIRATPGIESLELGVMVSQIPHEVVVANRLCRSYCRNESVWKG